MLSEQKMILYQSQTRNAFKKMANDTESLYVHRDIDSILTTGTTTTMNSTKSSMQFEFDTELFVSKIYQRWIRGSVKKTLHEQQSETSYSTRPTTKLRAIERALGVGTSRSHPECKVLLLGADSRPDLMKLLQLVLGNGDMHEQLKSYKEAIYKDVVTSAKALVTAMRKLEVAPDSDDIWEHADFVASFDPIWEHLTASGLDRGFKSALGVILGSQCFSDIMARSADFSFPTGAE
jgi:guanine nucleotide-binding protein subunit alpha